MDINRLLQIVQKLETRVKALEQGKVANMPSGTDQTAASAAAGQMYRDTDDGDTVKMGV